LARRKKKICRRLGRRGEAWISTKEETDGKKSDMWSERSSLKKTLIIQEHMEPWGRKKKRENSSQLQHKVPRRRRGKKNYREETREGKGRTGKKAGKRKDYH